MFIELTLTHSQNPGLFGVRNITLIQSLPNGKAIVHSMDDTDGGTNVEESYEQVAGALAKATGPIITVPKSKAVKPDDAPW